MKTSPYQFDLMVTFMEEHGDLSKPQPDAPARLVCLNKWEDLAKMLNADASGDSKNSSKWKKVWTDYKNNTKKKFFRIHRAEMGMGPPVHTKLTSVEKRVLDLMGVSVDTSFTVEDESSSQDGETIDIKPIIYDGGILKPSKEPRPDHSEEDVNVEGNPRVHSGDFSERPRGSRDYTYNVPLDSEDSWRQFRMQQHRDYMELKREQNHIRKMEIQTQLGWQDIGNRALDLLDKVVDRYCRD